MELFLPRDQHHNTSFAGKKSVDQKILATILYHDIFGYPLTQSGLIKWEVGSGKISSIKYQISNIKFKNGYYFLEGKDGMVFQRLLRERISKKKISIAEKAIKIISKLPTIKMIALTGSLAMQNANENSDIDLMIITRSGTLWMTRLISYVLLKLTNQKLRKPGETNEKDKLCLNIWMDESDLLINKQNIYTAHEVAQVVPLVNKDKTYERFLESNSWIKDYWPNSVKIPNQNIEIRNELKQQNSLFRMLNSVAFKLQYNFMKKKITKEIVTPTRAFFHPFDWGEYVERLGF